MEDKTQNDDQNELDQLQRKEEQALHDEALQREISEIRRRRQELGEELNSVRERLSSDSQSVQRQLEEIQKLEDKLQDIDQAESDTDKRTLHNSKNALRQVEMRLLKLNQQEEHNPNSEHTPSALTERSFLQLTRVGIALTWPLVLTMLICTGMLVTALMKLFMF